MWVQRTFPCVRFYIQKTYAHLPLFVFQLTRYVRSVFSTRCFLNIEQVQLTVRRKSNQVYWTLRHDWLINIAALFHQPRRSNKLTLSAITDSMIYSH